MENEGQGADAAGSVQQNGEEGRVPDLSPILTVEELAHFLRLNRKTVYEAVSRGEIPGVRRIGHTFRVSRDAVMQWLARSPGGVGVRRRPGP
jgi:excisionase family DNA binding protein